MGKNIYVGVDVGGTKILATVYKLDDNYKLLGKAKLKTPYGASNDEVIKQVEAAVNQSIEASNVKLKKISAIGIGVPGTTDIFKGHVQFAANLGWKDLPLKTILEKSFSRPVFVDNDVNLGILGEQQFGVAKNVDNVVGVFWGTGIGGGIIIHGKPVYGNTFTAGEIGHLILEKDGQTCGCGNQGCLETFSAKWAISQAIDEAIQKGQTSTIKPASDGKKSPVLKSKVIKQGYDSDDALVKQIMQRAVDYLGLALANVVNLLNPQMIVLGGGMIEAMEDVLMPKITEAVNKHTIPFASVDIKPAILGDYAVVLGAAGFAKLQLQRF
ncbi:MAG: ROK family protein [Caldithrix sp.]|nr:ROK family protein [Caldithrix sp.]